MASEPIIARIRQGPPGVSTLNASSLFIEPSRVTWHRNSSSVPNILRAPARERVPNVPVCLPDPGQRRSRRAAAAAATVPNAGRANAGSSRFCIAQSMYALSVHAAPLPSAMQHQAPLIIPARITMHDASNTYCTRDTTTSEYALGMYYTVCRTPLRSAHRKKETSFLYSRTRPSLTCKALRQEGYIYIHAGGTLHLSQERVTIAPNLRTLPSLPSSQAILPSISQPK